jgi:hypothetical protein
MEALMLVAALGAPTMFTRIGFMKALNRRVERVFNSDRRDHHWRERKLACDWREIFILAGAMKRMLILAVALWLGVSATAHAQVSSSVGTQPNLQVSSQTDSPANTVFSAVAPVAVPCPFGVSLGANLTAFGCASDPLGAPTYQFPAVAGATAMTTAPVGSIAANAQTVTPNATSGTASAGGGVSSSADCLGAIPSAAGSAGAGDLFGGSGRC